MIDRFPQPQLHSDAVVKPFGDIAAVEAFGRGRQAKHLSWLEMAEEAVVAVSRGMVELVDHNDIERVRRDLTDPCLLERLDHREYVSALGRSSGALDLAEVATPQDSLVCPERLFEDLLPVSDKKQR